VLGAAKPMEVVMKRIRDILPRRDRAGSGDGQPSQTNNEPEAKADGSQLQDQLSQESTIERLFEAVERGAADEVETLLSQDVPLDCRDEKERTPLIVAAFEGKLDLVNKLIDLRADIDAVDVYGESALIAATYGGHLDVVKTLVEKGASMEIQNNEGLTALGMAQEMDNNAVTSYLAAQVGGSGSAQSPETPIHPNDDDPSPSGPAAALGAPAMVESPEAHSYVDQRVLESIPGADESAYFKVHKEPEVAGDDRDDSSEEEHGSGSADSRKAHGTKSGTDPGGGLSFPANIQAANEERIEFDALDNKQVRNINQKVIKVLDKAGFEVGDYVIDTVFKGHYLAVLKPRSQENKRWRKLRKHPDWVIDPKRLTELAGACAFRRHCLAEGKDVSSFTISHFIELYYVKDLKLILTLADEASANNYTVRQLKGAADDLRVHKDDHDPGKEIIKTLDQPVPVMEDPDLMALCTDKDRVLEELSKAERKKIRALIKERKPGLDEWKKLMESFEGILSELEDE
jgi:hypothetical protein